MEIIRTKEEIINRIYEVNNRNNFVDEFCNNDGGISYYYNESKARNTLEEFVDWLIEK